MWHTECAGAQADLNLTNAYWMEIKSITGFMNCRIVLWNSVDAEKQMEKVRQRDSEKYLSVGHVSRKKMADIFSRDCRDSIEYHVNV